MRILADQALKQINWLDERFYTESGMGDPNAIYVPSVTFILDAYPKGGGFNQWLKDMGSNAEQIMERAGAIGTRVHDAINRLLKDEEVLWDSAIYSMEEWKYILNFASFWAKYKPTLLATEWSACSYNLGYGGTLDLVCEIQGETWLIDFKTSNALYSSFELQITAYRSLWNEIIHDHKIQRAGIFWFKALTRGEDKTGKKIQGEGWQLKEYERDFNETYSLFNAVHQIWKHEHPNAKPKNIIYPMSIKLNL